MEQDLDEQVAVQEVPVLPRDSFKQANEAEDEDGIKRFGAVMKKATADLEDEQQKQQQQEPQLLSQKKQEAGKQKECSEDYEPKRVGGTPKKEVQKKKDPQPIDSQLLIEEGIRKANEDRAKNKKQ